MAKYLLGKLEDQCLYPGTHAGGRRAWWPPCNSSLARQETRDSQSKLAHIVSELWVCSRHPASMNEVEEQWRMIAVIFGLQCMQVCTPMCTHTHIHQYIYTCENGKRTWTNIPWSSFSRFNLKTWKCLHKTLKVLSYFACSYRPMLSSQNSGQPNYSQPLGTFYQLISI